MKKNVMKKSKKSIRRKEWHAYLLFSVLVKIVNVEMILASFFSIIVYITTDTISAPLILTTILLLIICIYVAIKCHIEDMAKNLGFEEELLSRKQHIS